ncbi:MAG: DUF4293 domain-containing protein [Saprospiraceae bacterium]
MIQRIQSIFLLLASASIGGTFALPFADSSAPVADTFFADSLFSVFDSIPLMAGFGLAALLALVAIFLFNNRKLQKNIATASAILTIASVGVAIGQYMSQSEKLMGITIDDEPGLFLPAAGFVLAILAVRYINKDERLVRSADRLR